MIDNELKKKIVARLNRVEGQVSGIRRMIDDDAYCVDLLNQISAAQAALGKVGSIVLKNHLETCVADAFDSGDQRERHKKMEEVIGIFDKYGCM